MLMVRLFCPSDFQIVIRRGDRRRLGPLGIVEGAGQLRGEIEAVVLMLGRDGHGLGRNGDGLGRVPGLSCKADFYMAFSKGS